MPFNLQIKDNISKLHIDDHFFSKDIIMIGRRPENDLPLKDKFVSGLHAQIIKKNGKYFIIDPGSKNGVLLNDKLLKKNEPYPINNNDKIEIGTYSMIFQEEEENIKQDIIPSESTILINSVDVPHEAASISIKLRSVFVKKLHKNKEERIASLKEVIKKTKEKIGNKDNSKDILLVTIDFFTDKGLENDTENWQNRKLERAYCKVFSELALLYDQELKKPSTEKDVIKFGKKVKTIIALFIKQFSESLHVYKGFQEQFDVDSTKILNWGPNPIKKLRSSEKIGKFLFRWDEDNIEDIKKYLNEAHEDMLLHQLAVLKGFKKCFRELLMEISPTAIAEEVSRESEKFTYKKLLEKVNPINQKNMWNRYVKRHQELTENETRTFNTIKNTFQKTYLSFLKEKRGKKEQ